MANKLKKYSNYGLYISTFLGVPSTAVALGLANFNYVCINTKGLDLLEACDKVINWADKTVGLETTAQIVNYAMKIGTYTILGCGALAFVSLAGLVMSGKPKQNKLELIVGNRTLH